MRILGQLIVLMAVGGCAVNTSPTPAELAANPERYDGLQITTCGQVSLGGAKCSLMTPAGEIWLSSASKACVAPTVSIVLAEVSGRLAVLDSGRELVVRKASINPLAGKCPNKDT
jgi:hypothetical protein